MLSPCGSASLARRRRQAGLTPWRLRVLPVCASTEIELSRWLARTPWQGGVPRAVVARRQTHGQGQWGRRWQSPAGGVWLSAALPWSADHGAPGLLGLAVALALAERLERQGLPVAIKWPNDLLIGEDKLAGVLPRMVHRGGRLRLARVGVGVNVCNPVPDGAVALRQWLPLGRCDPEAWTAELLLALDRSVALAASPQALCQGVEGRIWTRTVRDPSGSGVWEVEGLSADGSLRLRQGTRTSSWTRWPAEPAADL